MFNAFTVEFIVVAIILLLIGLSGCASNQIPYNPSDMTADQLKAITADKQAVASCTTGIGPWGSVRTVIVQIDKSVVDDSNFQIDTDCKLQVQTKRAK